MTSNHGSPLTLRAGASDGRRILFVDDDVDQREVVSGLLRAEGYEVTTACDGVEALAALDSAEETPTAILTDLRMPVMTGWQLIDALGRDARWSEIPVMVMSATTSGPAIDSKQVVARLRKPTDVGNLFHGVEQACMGRRDDRGTCWS